MTDLEMRKLAECTREELIDMIIKLDKQLESNNSLKESIAKGIKEGLIPSVRIDGTSGQVYMKSDSGWSFQDCNYAVTSQLDEFKKLAKEAQELNKEIDFIIHNKWVDYKFITYVDDKYKTGRLTVLDPFSVTQEDIDRTKLIIEKLELLSYGYERGFDVFAKENYFNALDAMKENIHKLNIKDKYKDILDDYMYALKKDWVFNNERGSF